MDRRTEKSDRLQNERQTISKQDRQKDIQTDRQTIRKLDNQNERQVKDKETKQKTSRISDY